MSATCVTCPAGPVAPCACKKGEACIRTVGSCTQCPQNYCVANSNADSGSGSINAGVSAGGAVGGVAAVAIALTLLYFLWWKPRGLAASRKRYSRRLEARQSKRLSQLQPPPPSSSSAGNAQKRTSVHLPMDAIDSLSSRHSRSATQDADGPPSSTGATFGTNGLPRIRESFDSDNPFSDNQSRLSLNTIADGASARMSEFSFRSSQSTNIIPIAYIPPHSASMSLDDAQRDAYGGLPSQQQPQQQQQQQQPQKQHKVSAAESLPTKRVSVPASLASRDSLVINGSDLIDLHPLPAALSPDSFKTVVPTSSAGSSPSVPSRPPRAPGLDLSLPKKRASMTSPLGAATFAGARPLSGLLQRSVSDATRKPPLVSKFSSDTSVAPESPTGPSPVSQKEQAHLSVMSTSSSRSASSTMSYILDPPQIITPVNPQGVRRVEMLGRGHAGLVRLPTTTALTRTVPAAAATEDDPFADSNASRPDLTRRLTTSSLPASARDSVTSLPLAPPPDGTTSRWSDFTSTVDTERDSVSRRSLAISLTADPLRASYDSTQSDATEGGDNVFDDIPFVPPSASSGSRQHSLSPSAVGAGTRDSTMSASSVPMDSTPSGHTDDRISMGPVDEVDDDVDFATTEDDDVATSVPPATSTPAAQPVEAPNITTADEDEGKEQRASIRAPASVRDSSGAMSIRSGFGSGLSQIPFQLGFPSGFDDSSLMEDGGDDMMPPSARTSIASSIAGTSAVGAANRASKQPLALANVTEETNSPRGSWRSSSLSSKNEEDDDDEEEEEEGEVTQATRHKLSTSVSTVKAFSAVDAAPGQPAQQIHDNDNDDDQDPFRDA